MSIDRSKAREISRDVELALRQVAEAHGLDLQVGGGRFDSSMFSPKVTFKTRDADSNEFAMYASMYGLEASDFGREFTSQGRTFKVSGVAPRSPRRPILATEVSTGRTFKFTEAGVRSALRAAPAAPATSWARNLGAQMDRADAATPTYGLFGVCTSGPDTGRTNVLLKTSKSKASLSSYRSRNRINGAVIRELREGE